MKPEFYTLAKAKKIADRYVKAGYPVTKWLHFVANLLATGLECRVYDSRSTKSKYIYISRPNKQEPITKVRFSDHRPNRGKELENDSDFYVGVSNTKVSTTAQVFTRILYIYGVKPRLYDEGLL